MLLYALILLAELLALKPVTVKAGDCPATLPIEVNGLCYALKTDGLKFKDALDMCVRLGGKMTSVKSPELLDKVEQLITDFVSSKLEKAKFWIGLTTQDMSTTKAKEDRLWDWAYDESQIVQKDYKLWDEDGGPKKAGLTCAAIDGANDFLVKPLDCGGSRLPIICMMNKGKTCKHDAAPYLMYGDYCLAAVSYADAYGKVAPGCKPDAPTQYLEEMRSSVTMAAKNSFLGAGLYMYMRRADNKVVDLATGEEPAADMWEEGEPRDQYDCVALSVQPDNKLKLKTINCEFFASYLCVAGESSDY